MSAISLIAILLAALATVGLGAALLQILRFENLPPSLTVGVGYGLGVVTIGKVLLWASFAGLPLSVSSWVMVTTGITAGIWVLYRQPPPLNFAGIGSAKQSASLHPIPTRPAHKDPIILGLVLLIAAHLCITLGNNLTRPIFPWDAFTTWMYRAKAWTLQDAITPVATVPSWIAEGGLAGYALYASHYPTALSIYAAFASSLTGGWHSAAASTPWTLCLLALCLTAYGTLVLAGVSQRIATVGAYLLCSLPLLNVHAALAGYGDLWMALYSGCGLALLLLWRLQRVQAGLWAALLLLLAGTPIKSEGWLWLMLGLGFLSLEYLARRIGYGWLCGSIVFLGITGWVTGLSYISLGPLGEWGVRDSFIHAGPLGDFALRPYNPTINYFAVLLEQANFLLLASAYSFALLVMLLLKPQQAALLWLMALLITVSQAIIFAASYYSRYAETGTAITRVLLHFTPVAAVTVAIAWQQFATALQRRKVSECLPTDKSLNMDSPLSIWTSLIPLLIIALALVSPAAILLKPLNSHEAREALIFDAHDLVAMVGRTTSTEGGKKFIDSPINVGVLSAPLRRSGQPLPRYLMTDISIKEPQDASFYWILEGETDVQQISISASGKVIEDMHQYPRWQAENIKEIGYLVQKEALETTTLRGLSLQDALGFSHAATLVGQWFSSEPTSQRLINKTVGHIDAPINRNTWLSIGLITALIFVFGISVLGSKLTAVESAAGTLLTIWVLSDLTSIASSESLFNAFQNKRQHLITSNQTGRVLNNVKAKLGAQPSSEGPVLLIANDAISEFVTQKLPFELLPRGAVHTNTGSAAGALADWSGTVVVVGEAKQKLSQTAKQIAGDTPGVTIEPYDGFVLLRRPLP